MAPDVVEDPDWYSFPGPLTQLRAYRDALTELPSDVALLRDVVQGVVVHNAHRHRYGLGPAGVREAEEDLRTAGAILARVFELDPAPLLVGRTPDKRVVGSCRTFSVLLCALLREVDVPARARCGYWSYFGPTEFAWEHWACEYWDAQAASWKIVDAQLDDVQLAGFASEGFRIDFDPLDVPRDRFLVAGQVWRRCRAGQSDGAMFGIGDLNGLQFIRDDVLRDLASLNKVELLPGDGWGRIIRPDLRDTAEDNAAIDSLAAVISQSRPDVRVLRAAYLSDPLLQPGPTVAYLGPRARRLQEVPELAG